MISKTEEINELCESYRVKESKTFSIQRDSELIKNIYPWIKKKNYENNIQITVVASREFRAYYNSKRTMFALGAIEEYLIQLHQTYKEPIRLFTSLSEFVRSAMVYGSIHNIEPKTKIIVEKKERNYTSMRRSKRKKNRTIIEMILEYSKTHEYIKNKSFAKEYVDIYIYYKIRESKYLEYCHRIGGLLTVLCLDGGLEKWNDNTHPIYRFTNKIERCCKDYLDGKKYLHYRRDLK